MGRFAPSATYELRGTIYAEARTGDYRETVRMRDGAFVSRSRFNLFGEADGFDGRLAWHQDRSGASHTRTAPFTRADSISLAWLKRRGYLQPGSARIEKIEQERIADHSATTLTMRPRGGNPVRLSFDDRTHLLVRFEHDRPLSVVQERYSDYRTVNGARIPFHTEVQEIGGDGSTSTVQLGSVDFHRGDAGGFDLPPPPHDMVMTGASIVPLDSTDFAVAPATINGHTYDFIMDTGGHNIVTPQVAAQLGLTMEGKGLSGGSGAGQAPVSDTDVAELKLGSATMINQHFTVLDMNDAVKRKGKPDMAGILGLEIFERMAVTIDEPRNRLTVEPFRPGRSCDGDKVPLMFDDDQPAVRGTIDGIPAQIGIDVGNAGIPIVLWRWAEAHHVADKYRNGTKGGGSGVGGSNVTYRTKHHDIVVGRTKLSDVDVNYGTTPTGYFSSRADSMNLGRSLLQKYAVRFDYSRGEMCIIRPAG